VNGPQDFRLLGETLDDAVGEAYDKVARLLDLPYPGGPHLDRLAKDGDPKAFAFPRAMLKEEGYQFSLSGLKTSVRRTIEKYKLAGEPVPVEDIAASFQAAIVDVLVTKAAAAAEEHGLTTLALAGGVAANSGLRAAMEALCARRGWRLSLPPMTLCTDNAAMIAGLAHDLYLAGVRTPLEEEARSRMPMATQAGA
jgi:N6-L-threonylcarbamoyladenine synthase